MNLATFRDAIAAHFTSTYSELHVHTHGGEFTWDEVKRYSIHEPALVIAVMGATTDKAQMDGVLVTVRMSAVVLAQPRAGEARDGRVLRIASYVLRELAKVGQFWGLTAGTLQAPTKIRGENLFGPASDKGGVALFGLTWDQMIDCTPDTAEVWDDLKQVHADYDLGPVPGGDIEAQDDITLGRRELHLVTAAEVVAGYFTLVGTPTTPAGVVVRKDGEAALKNKQTIPALLNPNFDVLSTKQIHINNNGAADGLTVVIVAGDSLCIDF